MSNVISLKQKRYEKQLKAAGSEWSYIPSLDEVNRSEKVVWTAQSYQKALMKLVSTMN